MIRSTASQVGKNDTPSPESDDPLPGTDLFYLEHLQAQREQQKIRRKIEFTREREEHLCQRRSQIYRGQSRSLLDDYNEWLSEVRLLEEKIGLCQDQCLEHSLLAAASLRSVCPEKDVSPALMILSVLNAHADELLGDIGESRSRIAEAVAELESGIGCLQVQLKTIHDKTREQIQWSREQLKEHPLSAVQTVEIIRQLQALQLHSGQMASALDDLRVIDASRCYQDWRVELDSPLNSLFNLVPRLYDFLQDQAEKIHLDGYAKRVGDADRTIYIEKIRIRELGRGFLANKEWLDAIAGRDI